MRTVGVRELKNSTTEILRYIHQKGQSVQITRRGKVIALLVPTPDDKPSKHKRTDAVWTDLDRLAAEISAQWPKDISAAGAVSEIRRDL